MAGLLIVPGSWPVFDAAGDPVSGATISFFQPGTTTPKPVYSDSTLTTSLGSVLTTNSAGEPTTLGAVIAREWWTDDGGVYDIRIQAAGLDRTWDGIVAQNNGAANQVPLANITALQAVTWPLGRPSTISLVSNWTTGDGGGLFRWDAASTATDNGGTIIKETAVTTGRWFRQYVGAVQVKWFGALGNGVANDRSAFQSAHVAAGSGVIIEVPAGAYFFGASDLTVTGRRFLFTGAVTFPSGQLLGALFEIIDAATGAISYTTGAINNFSAKYKFGRIAGGVTGLQIGGADAAHGIEGGVLFAEDYSGWTTLQPSQYPSTVELAVQPSSAAGLCTTVASTNQVNGTSGATFDASWVGRRIYIEDLSYKIASFVSSTSITVTNLDNSAVSFSGGAAGSNRVFVIASVVGRGVCNTSGTAVTRVTGDPFPPIGNTEYLIRIGGVTYTVNSRANIDSLTLAITAGTQTAVAYEFWTSIDDITSAVRVQRLSGAGFEEVVSLAAYGPGYYHLHAASGATNQRPFYLGVGYRGDGAKRGQITLSGNGDTLIGGEFDRYSLRVGYRDGSTGNGVFINGANSGNQPSISAEGVDANIDLTLTPKGAGLVRLGPTIAGHATSGTARSIFVKDNAGNELRIAAYEP
jgi:hypothetical protein